MYHLVKSLIDLKAPSSASGVVNARVTSGQEIGFDLTVNAWPLGEDLLHYPATVELLNNDRQYAFSVSNVWPSSITTRLIGTPIHPETLSVPRWPDRLLIDRPAPYNELGNIIVIGFKFRIYSATVSTDSETLHYPTGRRDLLEINFAFDKADISEPPFMQSDPSPGIGTAPIPEYYTTWEFFGDWKFSQPPRPNI